jgi:LysR family transcriptional regulator, regulator for bpeEF and oprC
LQLLVEALIEREFMDKLRALDYCMAAAQEKSFSGAARRLEVSAAAVAKLVAALEKSLDQRLFERAPNGLTLTAAGAAYLEACAPALAQLSQADEQTRDLGARASGTVVIGVQHVIASGALTRALPHFHARYPEITLDIREFARVTQEETSGMDVILVMGWPQLPNLVHRRIAAGRFIVAASPSYWSRHGMPQRPKDLERHNCLAIRGLDGTLMDLWTFTRGEEKESVAARGWLVAGNTHRDAMIQLALAGEGVIRPLDWTNLDDIASGVLVRALSDWESPEAPPVNLLYRASVRRTPRVRLFIDFVTELFRNLEAIRGQSVAASGPPVWLGRHYGKSSAMLTRGR